MTWTTGPSTARRGWGRACLGSMIAVTLASAAVGQNIGPDASQGINKTAESIRDYSIAAGPLTQAINGISQQSGLQIVYDIALLNDKQAHTLKGQFSLKQALERTLTGTGLTYEFANEATVVIRKAPAIRTSRPNSVPAASSADVSSEEEPEAAETLTVTGSRIRGGSSPSPTVFISAAQMKEEGFPDLGEVIRSIPQNFSGGQNPGVASGASAGGIANQNLSGGSGLNLRGLGPDATLTLLSGRRMSYDGFVQAVDIAAIPIEAVQQLEVIPDGASAIYGSDAVAGVANVVLRPDFDGVTVGARYGAATDGGLDTREYSITAGTTWSGGGLLATYKDISTDPILADERDYSQNMIDPRSLYNGSDLRSALLSAHQSLGAATVVRVDAFRTERSMLSYAGYAGSYYKSDPESAISFVAPSVQFFLPAGWTVEVGGTRGENQIRYRDFLVTAPAGVASLQSRGCYCNESSTYEIGAEGPLFSVGGGQARLAAGVGSRSDDFLIQSYISGRRQGGSDRSRFGYAELNLPVIGPDSNVAAVQRLELIAALRTEDYDSFGQVTTPKLGVVYHPNASVSLKTSWGKSFKAPTLTQRKSNRIAYLWTAEALGGTNYPAGATVLMSEGGNEELDAERARSWTASLDFHPEAVPGLNLELSYFDIDYTERVVQPIGVIIQGLTNPNYAQFVQYSPTPQQQAALLATYSATFYNYADADYDPANVIAIARNQYINAANQQVRGVDLLGSYRLDLAAGTLQIRGSVSWLDSSQQNSPGETPFELAGRIFNPAQLSGRIGAVWSPGPFSVGGFVSYVDGVRSELLPIPEETGSFTTFDAIVRYDTGERADAFGGVSLALTVDNVFGRDPPLNSVPYTSYVPFDSTNYSAIGRFVSLTVAKHW